MYISTSRIETSNRSDRNRSEKNLYLLNTLQQKKEKKNRKIKQNLNVL